jgi:DNA-binding IscR family transcriptional regulator
MLHIHDRAKKSALSFLADRDEPISAEKLAEELNYSVRQTKRILAVLRLEHLVTTWRPTNSRALAYDVDQQAARDLGLL